MDIDEVRQIIAEGIRTKGLELHLDGLGLTDVPPEIKELKYLWELDLSNNRFSRLPHPIAQLKNLQWLDLSGNRLSSLPDAIANLKNLRALSVIGNRLASLPDAIGELSNLRWLELSQNEIVSLPDTIGQLSDLQELDLSHNRLISLPDAMGRLRELRELILFGNEELISPPPAVVKQGTKAILAYLREQLEAKAHQWVSKVLLVGEGGVGKTSLLNVLQGKECVEGEETTHGIEIRTLEVPHPMKDDVTMRLNAWDFGGQEIYHATHQFFLTGRSLFLLLWNSRYGWEQGKLYYWMDTIRARAPDAPIIIVATHVDERDADLPIAQLSERYPQIAGHFKVSNTQKTGIDELSAAIASEAAALPLMGEEWPEHWLNAAEALRNHPQNAISPRQMAETMTAHDVRKEDVPRLAQYLHDLGDILYYKDDPELQDTVILKPQWVSNYMSNVLECEKITDGVLHETFMRQLWSDLDHHVQDHFLRLMEHFDLSYRTLERPEVSIVVERLSPNPPPYEERWEAVAPASSVEMRYELNTIPAGIPTYFIARSHRFTLHLHWLYGALFSDKKEPEHLGLIRAFPHERYVELTVRGPYPHNFFALLRDGFELTLERFPGLRIVRKVPCPGHDDQPCQHLFGFEQLLRRLEKKPPKFDVECPEGLENVDVRELVFGLAPSTGEQALQRIEKRLDAASEELQALRALAQRGFTRAFNRDQESIDSQCPNVFALDPGPQGWRAFLASVKGRKIDLQLYCQQPGEWHPVKQGRYEFTVPPGWLDAMAPYVGRMVSVLRKAAPIAHPAVKKLWPEVEAVMGNDLELMAELVNLLPTIERERTGRWVRELEDRGGAFLARGMELHALRKVLDEVEPDWSEHSCGGLRKVLTPEGHYLWLCNHHAEEYRR